MLDVRRMRVLREVAARGTIAGAADALGFTPSAVSRQVAAFEREAGIALVDRGPRSVVLTQAGRTLVDHAEVVLAQLAEAEAELQAIAGLHGGHVRLGSFTTAIALVGPALKALRARHPEVEVTVVQSDAAAALASLQGGELDVAVVYSYDHAQLRPGRAIELRELMRDPALVALPRSHALAERDEIALRELAGERWLTEARGSVCHRFTVGACRAARFVPHVHVTRSDDYHVAQGLVAAGAGVAFVPELAVERRPELAFVRPAEPVGRTIAVACRAGGRRSPAVAELVDLLTAAAEAR